MIESNTNEVISNYIIETVSRIDKIQKEVVLDSTNTCVLCETSLLTSAYNTIPVSFKCISGTTVSGNIGVSSETAEYFRIESLRQNRFVTLRLLNRNDTALEATEYTMLLDLNYVMQIECYTPISITLCTQD